MSPENQGTLVIVPTYNERENVQLLLDKILELPGNREVLIVDDNSPDGTAEFIQQRYKTDSRVHLINREKKMGLGTAYTAGFHYAIDHGYRFALTMDADLSHDPKVIPALEETSKDFHLVIGSRYIPGGGVSGKWGVLRKLLSRTANALAHHFLSLEPADCTSGFRIYRTDALKNLDYASITADGYSYLVEILHRAVRCHWSIGEVPILFVDRRHGRSKISRKEIFKAMHTMLRLRFTRFKT